MMTDSGMVGTDLKQNQSLVPRMNQSRSLWLRRTVPADAEILFHKGFSQQEFMRLFRLNDQPTSVEVVRQRLIKRQQLPPNKDRYLELLITHKRHGPIGLCALADYAPQHKRAEYLVGLFNARQRSVSYGVETTLMVFDLAFNSYKMNKVCAIAYSYNQSARSGLLNIGFASEGQRREHVFDSVSQAFVDLCDYGMTATDFRSSQLIARLSQRFLRRDITQPQSIPASQRPNAPQDVTSPPQFVHSGARLLHPPPSAQSPALSTIHQLGI